jgi:probable HAF family extracellular repeat protein
MNRHLSFLAVLMMCLVCSVSQATTYNVTDLGTLPGGTYSDAYGINASGQVVGFSDTTILTDYSPQHAFLYSGSTMTDLGTLGGTYSEASGINASGQVVGWSDFNYSENGTQYITHHAFLYNGSTMTDLGTLGGVWSYANGINASGQVVGGADTTGDNAEHAFLYSGSTMTDLGTLGGSDSSAWGINASGQVVGRSWTTGNAAQHAFLYNGSTMTDLGTLGGPGSFAHGINASGQVVGEAETDDAAWHPFIYSGGTMLNLNTLVDPLSGWTLYGASAINDAGQIVGLGFNGSQEHAFLLTPKSTEISWLNTNSNWGSESNWSPNTVPQLGGKAIFANSTATITLDGDRTVSDLKFNSGSYTISPGSVPSSKLIVQSPGNWATTIDVLAGSHTIDVPLEMDSDLTITIADGATLTMDQISDLDGSKNLTVNGDLTVSGIFVGTLTMSPGSTLNIAPITGGLWSGRDGLAEPVPEPSTLTLLGISIVGLLAFTLRRHDANSGSR